MQHFTCKNLNSISAGGDSHSGAKKTVRTANNIRSVSQLLHDDSFKDVDDPDINTCRKNALGLSKSSLHRIMKLDLKLYCYKMDRAQTLNPQDFA